MSTRVLSGGALRQAGVLAACAVLAAAAGLAVSPFVDMVRVLGIHVPRPDILGDYLAAVLWAVALGVSIVFWPVPREDRPVLLALWAVKCVVVLGFMLLYEAFYPVLDAYLYLDMARTPAYDFGETGLGKGTENVAGLVWLHGRLITSSYHAIKVTFALLGLVGVYLTYRGAVRALGYGDLRVLWILALFPSVMFWSSILGKDPLALLGIGMYAYGVMSWVRTRRWVFLLVLALGVWIATLIRLWAGPILLFPLIVFAVGGIPGWWRKSAFIALAAGATLLTVSRFADAFGLETAQDVIATTDAVSRAWAEGGSGQRVQVQFTGVGSMVRFAPYGAFTALFRPLPGEVMNPFGMLAGLENVVLLALVAAAALRTRLRTLRRPLVLWAAVLVAVWASVYGFISFQNLGTAVRFKLQILPVLLLLLLYLSRKTPPPLEAEDVAGRVEPLLTEGHR